VGSRPDSRDTFFCIAKRKYPKKRRPGCRFDPARRSFRRGSTEGASCPSVDVRHPCRTPTGYSRRKLRCSARHTGGKTVV
ncbi:hypothetical protein, partial [Methylomonas albis]